MAYNSGIENYLLSKVIDKQWYDDLNAKKSEWTVVDEFTLTPEGDTPPMKPMGRAFDVQAGQVFRSRPAVSVIPCPKKPGMTRGRPLGYKFCPNI